MLSLKEFKKHINKIGFLFECQEKFNSVLEELSGDSLSCDTFIYGDAISQVVDLLETIMGDTENQWISYWVYELNMGKDWVPDSVTGIFHGSSEEIKIRLKTVEDLYSLLLGGYYDSKR